MNQQLEGSLPTDIVMNYCGQKKSLFNQGSEWDFEVNDAIKILTQSYISCSEIYLMY